VGHSSIAMMITDVLRERKPESSVQLSYSCHFVNIWNIPPGNMILGEMVVFVMFRFLALGVSKKFDS